jgi:hypothetical protein
VVAVAAAAAAAAWDPVLSEPEPQRQQQQQEPGCMEGGAKGGLQKDRGVGTRVRAERAYGLPREVLVMLTRVHCHWLS